MTSFAKSFAQRTGEQTKTIIDKTIVALQLGFDDYLQTSYNKCKYFKSILNPNLPLEVTSHYVNVSLTCGTRTVKDNDLIDDFPAKRHVVITGTAGSGKSMFMKFATVKHFEFPKGIIPLFVELRQINDLTNKDLLTYIRVSCTSKMHNVTPQQFDLSIKSGAMMLILDGFDEINYDLRDNIQQQIREIEKDFPKCIIVVSSRPDARFGGWSTFHVYCVNALTRPQTIKLIESLDYNPGVKRRFLKEIKGPLYSSHGSFLSSPLLASIMLLTYEQFAEVPQKMHEFYSQAFDTLFQKHDAQKEQFQRKTRTGLSKDDFKSCFSAFCAMSYLDGKFNFKTSELTKFSAAAVRYVKRTQSGFPAKLTNKQLIDDLFESVCVLQPDGLESTFVHRSFQEYFTAHFLTGIQGSKIAPLMDKCAVRFQDTVIPMALDMAREIIEREWVIRAIEGLESRFWPSEHSTHTVVDMYKVAFDRCRFARFGNDVEIRVDSYNKNVVGVLEVLATLYPKNLKQTHIVYPMIGLDVKAMSEAILPESNMSLPRYDDFAKFLGGQNTQRKYARNAETELVFELTGDAEWWLRAIGAQAVFEEIKNGLSNIKRAIRQREKSQSDILRSFFQDEADDRDGGDSLA